ncbi:MAG: response regulator transcription factor [Solirubrobacterales bacterium]|nr:response regulator transcription factor [Solirubrobacterales bacterium]MBV9473442.1 response regulator transcription factor [Solirubrobacterales bacterium]MBV9839824.1 response regulator transcription factor [Solirubrobacterales bacterium]
MLTEGQGSVKLVARSAGRSVRLLVADGHDLYRVGLASLLGHQPGIEIVAQASGGRMAVRLARELHPDVVLLDPRMADIDGLTATRAIVADDPAVRIVFLTVSVEHEDVAAAVVAGACGYLVKDSPIEEIMSAIRSAAAGDAWLSSRAATAVLDRVRSHGVEPEPTGDGTPQLSPRELEVLRLLARGLENAEIAASLGIGPRTAKNHVSSILAKLGVTNRIQAAVYAVRRGLD